MKTILTTLCTIFLYKLVEDNIPNLHYKNLIIYLQTLLISLTVFSLCIYYLINKQAQKDIQLVIGIILIAAVVSEINNNEKKKINNTIKI